MVNLKRITLTIAFLSIGNTSAALTCSLKETITPKDIHGFDQSYKYSTVTVEMTGNFYSNNFAVKQISFDDVSMPWCYEAREEWRCGSIPEIRDSVMLNNAKLEFHASAKFYLEGGKTMISYSAVALDNARAPQNQITVLNYLEYFKGEYACY